MKIKPNLPKTKMLEEAKLSKSSNVVLQIVYFIIVFIIATIIEAIPVTGSYINFLLNSPEYKELVSQYSAGEIDVNGLSEGVMKVVAAMPESLTILTLFATALMTATVFVYCRFIEKRKLTTLGFRKKGFVGEYLVGLVIGAGLFSAAVGINFLTGALTFGGFTQSIAWGTLGLYLVGWLIQGMAEEVMFRGYFMVSMSRRIPVSIAVLISSVGFALAHSSNQGVSPLAYLNLTLFGIFAAVYMLKRGNIWGVCAIHSMWNCVQGNLYGVSVSGMSKSESIMNMISVESKSLMNGGAFGLEGGLAVTIVLTLATIIMLCTKTKQSELAHTNAQQVSAV